MKSFELIPTEENLIEALKMNLIKRNEDLGYFYNLLQAQELSCSIALDGRWGSGKTFFVKQSMMLINAKNPMSKMSDDKRGDILKEIPLSTKAVISKEQYNVAVYYDAWENDNEIDPILSLVYEIAKQLGMEYSLSDDNRLFGLAASIIEVLSGRNVTGILKNLKSNDPLAKIKEEKDLHKNIKSFFGEVLIERGNRLVIFVDELDRCKPSFTVKLLERIKHYIDDERITVVFSVNMSELQHIIRHYYGSQFDASRYLDRFFDMRISLPPADRTDFFREVGLESQYILEKVCRKVIDTYNMEMREICRYYRQVKTAVYKPTHDSRNRSFWFAEGKANQFLLMYIVPVLVGLKITNIPLYDEFISGKNSKPLMDIYNCSDEGRYLAAGLLNNNETFDKISGMQVVTIEQKIQQLYEAIFVTEYSGVKYCTVLGELEFNKNSKRLMRKVESMFSDYVDYDV